MSKSPIRGLLVMTAVLTGGTAGPLHAQEAAGQSACAQLLPAIESLKAMLAQEAKARTADNEVARMQIVTTLLGVRYRNLESLEASLRSVDAAEDDLRGAISRTRAQLEAVEEAARNSGTSAPDPGLKMQRTELEANAKGFEEQVKALTERRSSYQAQLSTERRDIDRLEAVIRAWLERAQP